MTEFTKVKFKAEYGYFVNNRIFRLFFGCLPDKFFSESKFPFMLRFLESVPGFVDVRNKFTLGWKVGPLVVGPHFTLKGKQHDLKVTLLYKSERQRESVVIVYKFM